jgi:SHS family lactate transporter-like MFS transporter
VAAFLGWTLDAFDFFLLVFVLKDIAQAFGTDITAVSILILLTLGMRPLGALIFGRFADRYGRRPTLMIDVLLYSVLGFASGFAPSLAVLLVLRALFGIAMGGEWGVGASLTMESIPARARGTVSGLLQAGYPTGYLLAALAYATLYPHIGWRGMLMLGAVPALLILFIRRNVPESPLFSAEASKARRPFLDVLRQNGGLVAYALILMTAFNFLSHGTQDLYPTFLSVQRGLDAPTVGWVAIICNIGAIIGGIVCGMLSERFGRRYVITIAALCVLPMIPLWASSTTPLTLALGAFLMQIAVQGAWGVVPAHLNELSPPDARGTFPGLVYQLGNFLAASNATVQASVAAAHGGNYALALAWTAGLAAIVVAALTMFGREARAVDLRGTSPDALART